MFAWRLALATGHPHPDFILERMTSAQFTEAVAFYGIEPFGDVRGDIQAGVIASTIANVHRDPKKRKKHFAVTDFMPFIQKAKVKLSDRIRAAMRQLKSPEVDDSGKQ